MNLYIFRIIKIKIPCCHGHRSDLRCKSDRENVTYVQITNRIIIHYIYYIINTSILSTYVCPSWISIVSVPVQRMCPACLFSECVHMCPECLFSVGNVQRNVLSLWSIPSHPIPELIESAPISSRFDPFKWSDRIGSDRWQHWIHL